VLAKEKGFVADGETYQMLVQGFGRQGRRKEGEAVLDEMLDSTKYCLLTIGFLMAYFREDLCGYNIISQGL
jgi:pentatricopeptide repeat protein